MPVGARGFEPPTFWSQTRRASQAAPRPANVPVYQVAMRPPRKGLGIRSDQGLAGRGQVADFRGGNPFLSLRFHSTPIPNPQSLLSTHVLLQSLELLVVVELDDEPASATRVVADRHFHTQRRAEFLFQSCNLLALRVRRSARKEKGDAALFLFDVYRANVAESKCLAAASRRRGGRATTANR